MHKPAQFPDQPPAAGADTHPEGSPTSRRDLPANPQKNRRGLERVWHATGYSLAGLKAGWHETAFRQEALASIVLLPAAFWLSRSWVESVLLAGTVVIVMIIELLNTGIETAIDRIGPEWHDLSKRAKDMGSAAVLLSLVLCAGTWLMALFARFAN
ncbi:MAG: diacylglycerol kinase [Polaromonas sp. 39-63-203]|uniref:diacylglycerol kinase n=1 Tax=Polaromonas sp. TaxID=1869339 RepID=UPI000BD601DA|nr:diacylglycerol kinase [Polaromonas sp.]OYY53628.1 MAG: diacylglycerol kinase [Polaromonas sp. 35-63-240]OYZ02463.1 MAG: diacylglycerol kinase [Polaromonas sp. 28-63-22]OYZ84320.1 MAG: diacylglycerol kinase [Polaromonas sp. 24-62-144]OZB02300.1 MAG: diacylglycerol kinase [Polaromonas sp. 39-63-203]HQS33069.1 diacylglycerol kinase [Polaromonas sp.]